MAQRTKPAPLPDLPSDLSATGWRCSNDSPQSVTIERRDWALWAGRADRAYFTEDLPSLIAAAQTLQAAVANLEQRLTATAVAMPTIQARYRAGWLADMPMCPRRTFGLIGFGLPDCQIVPLPESGWLVRSQHTHLLVNDAALAPILRGVVPLETAHRDWAAPIILADARTDAHRPYLGFGSTERQTVGSVALVATVPEHTLWQMQRLASGMRLRGGVLAETLDLAARWVQAEERP